MCFWRSWVFWNTHTQKILWQILNESNWEWVKFRICFSTTVRQCHKFDRGRGDSVFCFAFFEEGLEDFKFGSDSKIIRCSAPASANHHVVCCQSTVLSLLKQGGRTNSSAASQRSKKKVEGKILCAGCFTLLPVNGNSCRILIFSRHGKAWLQRFLF